MNEISKICTECTACMHSCPKKAISFTTDIEGFSYPVIDQKVCINCGLCQKVCPVNNFDSLSTLPLDVFAAQLKERDILLKSSSGGMFYLISNYVINNNGVVYGATLNKNMKTYHIGVDSMDKLLLLMGSKYVHSDLGDCYSQIKSLLKQNRLVYFNGTPCQVAGLKSYLRKDYCNLITSDIICHGTPSQKIFDLFIHHLCEETNAELVRFSFRDKMVYGWRSMSSTASIKKLKTNKIKELAYNKNMRAYYNAFISGDITRYDCFKCPFAQPRRVGDFTIGDYWDIEKLYPDFPNIQDGVSVITINTAKGQDLWNNIKGKCTIQKSSLSDLKKTCNRCLFHPTPMPKTRNGSIQKAFDDFISFRNNYHTKKEESDFKKIQLKKIMRKNWLFSKLLDVLGK